MQRENIHWQESAGYYLLPQPAIQNLNSILRNIESNIRQSKLYGGFKNLDQITNAFCAQHQHKYVLAPKRWYLQQSILSNTSYENYCKIHQFVKFKSKILASQLGSKIQHPPPLKKKNVLQSICPYKIQSLTPKKKYKANIFLLFCLNPFNSDEKRWHPLAISVLIFNDPTILTPLIQIPVI